MENMINRLIKLGYEDFEAEKLYEQYEKKSDLQGLFDYICTKESINESLSEIL